MYRLLACCARARCQAIHYAHLAQELNRFTAWEHLPAAVERHGLAPLCYVHWRAAGAVIPFETRLVLQGLYLRHYAANRVRLRVLREILAACNAAGMRALVLKGAALGQLVYPAPGLRPMRDLDLLVDRSDARQTQRLLAKLGFCAAPPAGVGLPDKHLAAAMQCTEQGVWISVEIHHNLFNADFPASMGLAELTAPPLPFELAGLTAYTLGYEDMLWHLCQHLTYHTSIFETFRLIWAADIVSFAEQFAGEIDWDRIGQQYPLVLQTLSWLHVLTPLPESLRQQAGLKRGRILRGIGVDFTGWPRSPLAQQRQKGWPAIIQDTFFPSEWWLRLRYGLGARRPLFWYRWVRHPFEIMGWGSRYLLDQMDRRGVK
jgi:hypothetical protein